jgi:hypothetical protein
MGMKSGGQILPKDDLVQVGLWGAGIWIAVLVTLGLVPPAPDGDYDSTSTSRVIAFVVFVIAWLVALFVASSSLRVRGRGLRFQFFRVVAFTPVWLFVILPAVYLVAVVLGGP